MLRTLILILLLLPLAGFGQSIYRTTDEDGNVIFTDAPPAGAEQVELPPTNTAPPPTPMPRPVAPEKKAAPAAPSVAITSPANESTIAMGPGNFSVTASVKPNLGRGQMLQLSIDGKPWGEPQGGSSWALTNIFRGGHDLVVSLVDEDGETLATSEAIRVYVLRPSINSPARGGN